MFNGIVLCLDSNNTGFMKKGNIYIFKNGRCIREDGDVCVVKYTSFEHLVEMNSRTSLKLISPKELLRSDDLVVYRDGTIRVFLKYTNTLHSKETGLLVTGLHCYSDDLKWSYSGTRFPNSDIVKIIRDGKTIWEDDAFEIEKARLKKIESLISSKVDEVSKLVMEYETLKNKIK